MADAGLSQEEIEHRFGFHKATIEGPENTSEKHARLRGHFKEFAQGLNSVIGTSREASLAMTHLEEASMWAHKAVAKNAPLADDNKE